MLFLYLRLSCSQHLLSKRRQQRNYACQASWKRRYCNKEDSKYLFCFCNGIRIILTCHVDTMDDNGKLNNYSLKDVTNR